MKDFWKKSVDEIRENVKFTNFLLAYFGRTHKRIRGYGVYCARNAL